MPIRLAPIAAAAALVTPMALAQPAAHIRTTLKAVVFEGVSPPYQKTEPGYEVFGVDVLEQIRTQSDLREVENNSVDFVKRGLNDVIIGKAERETNSCRHGTKILVQVLLRPFEKGNRSITIGGVGDLPDRQSAEVITIRSRCSAQKADESSDTLGGCPTGISQREIGHS